MTMKKITPLQVLIHLAALFPLAKIIFDYFTHSFSPNPIQELEQRTGFTAITLLILSLTCRPLNILFTWREFIKRRRTLGLYAFFYASLHALVFIGLDYGFSWSLMRNIFLEKRFILAGTISFILLTPLAITSFGYWKARLGKNWRRLHSLVYLIAPLATIHFAWARKGDIFTLQGNVLLPAIYSFFLIILFVLRIKIIRKKIVLLRSRIRRKRYRRDPIV